jgi:hypothetical protein
MSTVQVKNSSTGAMSTKAAKRSRYEKLETGYGKIPAAAYAVGDTLSFDHFPMKSIVYAKFVSNGYSLEVFHGTDVSSALAFDIHNSSSAADISYVISYIKGTGNVNTSTAEAGEGVRLQLTVSSS